MNISTRPLATTTIEVPPSTTCGNGVAQGPTEQCDDGNLVDGDGCDNTCTWSCFGAANPAAAVGDPVTGACYARFSTGSSWTDAQNACVALGGNLASITSAAETTLLAPLGVGAPWIGASDAVTENTFTWSNGEPFAYTSWGAGEPNNQGDEDCVQVGTNGLWNDNPCTSLQPYICEAP